MALVWLGNNMCGLDILQLLLRRFAVGSSHLGPARRLIMQRVIGVMCPAFKKEVQRDSCMRSIHRCVKSQAMRGDAVGGALVL